MATQFGQEQFDLFDLFIYLKQQKVSLIPINHLFFQIIPVKLNWEAS